MTDYVPKGDVLLAKNTDGVSLTGERCEPVSIDQHAATAWLHVSHHELPIGTVLVPGGGESPDPAFMADMGDDQGVLVQMPGARREFVWLAPDIPDAMEWAAILGGTRWLYVVEPLGDVWPWNGTGRDGFVARSARVVNAIDLVALMVGEDGDADAAEAVGS